MVFRSSKYIVAIGSTLMMLLMISVLATSIMNVLHIRERLESIVSNHLARTAVLYNMRNIVRERSHSMYAIFLLEDAFDQDAEFIHFNQLASDFIKQRQRLETLGMSPQLAAVFEEAKALIRQSAPLQDSIVNAMMDGVKADRFDVMSAVDLPLEKLILDKFDELVAMEQHDSEAAIASTYLQHEYILRFTIFLGILVLGLSVVISLFTMRRISNIEGVLHKEKELAEVTLQAIGDGMITTDAATRIIYLNPRAAQLTGWNGRDAIGKPLREIFRLLAIGSNLPLDHPAFYSDISGPVTGLQQHKILLNHNELRLIVEDSVTPIRGRDGQIIGNVLVFRDVTYEHELSKQLNWQASHDPLTGLINRREFELDLTRLLASTRQRNTCHCFLYIDLDQFKIVNDTCGHIAGDELLKQVATLLVDAIRSSDVLARLGGDEFGLLLEGCDVDKASIIANSILDRIRQFRFPWDQSLFSIGASIGLVRIDKDSENPVAILSAADAACYMAKDKGRNRLFIHELNDQEIVKRQGEMRWIAVINESLEHNRFLLHQQLVKPISHPELPVYHELLLRMLDKSNVVIDPMSFIPAAERFGSMPKLDRWVIANAFRLVSQANPHRERALYAINISAQSLNDKNFLRYIIDTASISGIAPEQICFEITETTAIANLNQAHHFIATLRTLGFNFALDDFGSGMSSFAYLKNLAVDFIKIDGTFIKDVNRDPMHLAIVKSIATIARVMDVKIIGEWVEDAATLHTLQNIGIDYAQGFHIHIPEPLVLADRQQQLG